jgi:beta-galactosidase
VIGYQADNETKHYETCGPHVQAQFVKYLQKAYGTTENLNKRLGLDYWSNRVNRWEDCPSADGTINAGFGCAFARFQRQLVTDFLAWQSALIGEYRQQGQFITHNFDFEWKDHSYGVQPDVDQLAASRAFDIVGIDVYHPSQEQLTGTEISFCGDIARSLGRSANYLVLETQAQGFAQWTPYPGQLRLQAFSHIASGACMVEYWHWHSIHNAQETYWKGVLSHDLECHATYDEAVTIGRDFARLSDKLAGLRINNRTAILISNASLTAMKWFPLPGGVTYNDIVRRWYDALYRMNVGCDFIHPDSDAIERYSLIIVPALYSAPNSLLERLNQYVENGGHILYTFKSGFCNEDVTVRHTAQPGIIGKACGVTYDQFAEPNGVTSRGSLCEGLPEQPVSTWMELLTPSANAETLAAYTHRYWGEYAAITCCAYGSGIATYVGCGVTDEMAERILEHVLRQSDIWCSEQTVRFPVIVKTAVNREGKTVHFVLNYAQEPSSVVYAYNNGVELLMGKNVSSGEMLTIEPWGVAIVEEDSFPLDRTFY